MRKKIGRIFLSVLLFSVIAIVQYSFIFSLPAVFNRINLIVIALTFILFFFNSRAAVYASPVFGFWLDLYSFEFFGFHTLLLFLTVILADRIFRAWLTNRSLYSFLLLLLAATAIYNLTAGFLFYFSGASYGGFFLWRGSFWSNLFYQFFWSEAIGLLAFILTGILTRRFKPFFLEKG